MVYALEQGNYHSDYTHDSYSSLKLFNDNRIRYEQSRVFGESAPFESSWEMDMGNIVETLLLQTSRFPSMYAVDEKDDAKTKRKRKRVHGRDLITTYEMQLAYDICKGLMRHPTIEAWVSGKGQVQRIYTWEDEQTGLPCKIMVDKILDDVLVVGDLKITEDPSPAEWIHQARRFGYGGQQAFYEDGLRANGIKVAGFFFAVGSRQNPDVAAAYLLPEEMVEAGRAKNRQILAKIADAKRNSDWHLPKLRSGLYQL